MFFRQSADRLFAGDFSPESFQVVTVACFRQHQVYDDAAEIEQNPAACGLPVFREGVDLIEIAQLALNEICKRTQLRFGVRGGNYEPVCDRGLRADMNFKYMFGQFFLCEPAAEIGEFSGGRRSPGNDPGTGFNF